MVTLPSIKNTVLNNGIIHRNDFSGTKIYFFSKKVIHQSLSFNKNCHILAIFAVNQLNYSNTGFKQWYCPQDKNKKIVRKIIILPVKSTSYSQKTFFILYTVFCIFRGFAKTHFSYKLMFHL